MRASGSKALRALAAAGTASVERLQARLVLRLLLGAIFVETIGAQPGAEGEVGRNIVGGELGALDLVDEDRGLGLPGARKVRLDASAHGLRDRRIELPGLAEAGHHHAGECQARGCDQLRELVLLALELAARERARECPSRQFVELGGTRRQLALRKHAHHHRALLGQLALAELDVHEGLANII